MENEILRGIEFDDKNGALSYKGVRYLILRPETIMGMFKALVAEIGWEKAGDIFYRGGFEGGRASSVKFREVFGLSPHEAAEYICGMGCKIGWGKFELEEFNLEAKKLRIAVKSSPFAEQWIEAGKPVCHFLRGVVGGLGSASFDTDAPAVETSCLAAGGEDCRFVVKG